MHTVDQRDTVIELGVANPDPGAPLPVIISGDHIVQLAYIVCARDAVGVVAETDEPLFARVSFQRPVAHMFGPPNDEAFGGHPLASRGLRPYGVYEVAGSSWIRALERMNAFHPRHSPALFGGLRHFIFSFHDSTFECVARDLRVDAFSGSLASAVRDMVTTAFPTSK